MKLGKDYLVLMAGYDGCSYSGDVLLSPDQSLLYTRRRNSCKATWMLFSDRKAIASLYFRTLWRVKSR